MGFNLGRSADSEWLRMYSLSRFLSLVLSLGHDGIRESEMPVVGCTMFDDWEGQDASFMGFKVRWLAF